ncbi:Fic/DOC family protein [Kribbella endophytica]
MTEPGSEQPAAEAPVSETERWNRLFWEPDGKVLRNKLGLTDYFQLRDAEYRIRAMRQGEIDRGEVDIPRTFDAAHLQAIHQHLFQDVYDWAGQPRDVGMQKGGQPFVEPEATAMWVERTGTGIRAIDWPNLPREEFVSKLATAYAELNLAHPFREGNGASTKLFLQHVTEATPYRLDYDRADKFAWDLASMKSRTDSIETQVVQFDSLVPVFDQLVVDREPAATPELDPELAKSIALQNSTYPELRTDQRAQDVVPSQQAAVTKAPPEREV